MRSAQTAPPRPVPVSRPADAAWFRRAPVPLLLACRPATSVRASFSSLPSLSFDHGRENSKGAGSPAPFFMPADGVVWAAEGGCPYALLYFADEIAGKIFG